MPYIKQAEAPFVKVRRLLLGYGLNATELAAVLNCSYNTAARRLEHPETFTLTELAKISTKGHIPMDEIREVIKN